jgi:hypothetical protein
MSPVAEVAALSIYQEREKVGPEAFTSAIVTGFESVRDCMTIDKAVLH